MSVPVVVLPQSRASTIRRRLHLTNHRSSALESIALGILFALLMQVRPFRWAVYALLGWGAFLWVQDWWSEHPLPDDTPALAWSVEEATAQPVFSTGNPSWRVTVRAVNRGTETIQSATLEGTLYECPDEGAALTACTPVDRSRDHLALDLPPGFVHHLSIYPAFHHAGGQGALRVTWRITHIIADRDAEG